MEPITIFILVLANSFIFVALIVLVQFISKRGMGTGNKTLARQKSLIEQRMVLEAISDCAIQPDTESVIRSVGGHAAEMTGYNRWMIWLRTEENQLRIYATGGFSKEELFGDMYLLDNPRLINWVSLNLSPIRLGDYVVDLVDDERLAGLFRHFIGGQLLPLVDGEKLMGFMILGGVRAPGEERSEQFLSLFGATAAVMIKKGQLDELELKRQQKVQREQNLAKLGHLAAGLAHEIRNPLTFIKSATQHFAEHYELEPEDRDMSRLLLEEINRIDQHISELLVLGRMDQRRHSELNIVDTLRKTVRLAQNKAREKEIDLTLEPGPGELWVIGNEELIRQLFLNILVNSIEAFDKPGRIIVSYAEADANIVIDFIDTGPGVPADVVERMFDPFFSTKEKGTGLGLAIAHSVVSAHGGTMEYIAEEPGGAHFHIEIPLRRSE